MTEGVVQTKDTKIFFGYTPESSSTSDPELEVLQVACPTGIQDLTDGEQPRGDMTCLSSQVRQYYASLADPPALSLPVNFIPRSEAHQALRNAKKRNSNLVMPWLIAMSDSETAPTTVDSDGQFVSPEPTTFRFLGYVSNFTLTATVGAIWTGVVTIQMTSEMFDHMPTADLP